jgi:hypothetical protein
MLDYANQRESVVQELHMEGLPEGQALMTMLITGKMYNRPSIVSKRDPIGQAL